MRIKIDTKNQDKIESALAAVNGTSVAFTVCDLHEIQRIIRIAEARLSPLPLSMRKGVSVRYRPGGPNASSYKYMAISTSVWLERGPTCWFLTNVLREMVSPKQAERFEISISKQQAEEFQKRVIADFIVREGELPKEVSND